MSKLTLIGGSSSAQLKSFGSICAQNLNMTFYNPSQGYTGSDWAASFMDHLVPSDTTHLIWEFAINDWKTETVRLSADEYRSRVLNMFLQRTHILLPQLQQLIFIVLWEPGARSCWPKCKDDKSFFNTIKTILHMKHIKATVIDFNNLAKQHFSSTTLFKDGHHPSEDAHQVLGKIISEHVCLHNCPTVFNQKIWPLTGFEKAFLRAQSCVFTQPSLPCSLNFSLVDIGRRSKSRNDIKTMLSFPKCPDYGSIPVNAASFIGLNTKDWRTFIPPRIWHPNNTNLAFVDVPPEFKRGFMAPNMWYDTRNVDVVNVCSPSETLYSSGFVLGRE